MVNFQVLTCNEKSPKNETGFFLFSGIRMESKFKYAEGEAVNFWDFSFIEKKSTKMRHNYPGIAREIPNIDSFDLKKIVWLPSNSRKKNLDTFYSMTARPLWNWPFSTSLFEKKVKYAPLETKSLLSKWMTI